MVSDILRIFAGVNPHAHLLDFLAQLVAALYVELFSHQYRRELDDVGFHAKVFQRARRFQTQQAAADHRAAFAAARALFNRVQIFDGAIDETVRAVGAFNRRDPRPGAGGEDQFVILHGAAAAGVDHLFLAVKGDRPLAKQYANAMFFIIAFTYQRKFFSRMMREVCGKMDAVVSHTRFFTEDGNVELARFGFIDQFLNEAVANHAITNDGEFDNAHFCLKFDLIGATIARLLASLLMCIN